MYRGGGSPCTVGVGPESLYGEVQCILGNGHMGTPEQTDRQTETTENITFPQLRWGR